MSNPFFLKDSLFWIDLGEQNFPLKSTTTVRIIMCIKYLRPGDLDRSTTIRHVYKYIGLLKFTVYRLNIQTHFVFEVPTYSKFDDQWPIRASQRE